MSKTISISFAGETPCMHCHSVTSVRGWNSRTDEVSCARTLSNACGKRLARQLKAAGWVDCGDNHWSKQGVGYIRRTPGRDSWEASPWLPDRLYHYPTIRLCVERLEFARRANAALDDLFARLGFGDEAAA